MKKIIKLLAALLLTISTIAFAGGPPPFIFTPTLPMIDALYGTTPTASKCYPSNDGTCTALSASLPVFTDSNKALTTKSIADTLTALGLTNSLVYKGAIDCSGNPNYPAADAGDTYVVSVDGKIGGASGVDVITGDLFLCKTDGTAAGTQAAVGAQWNIIEQNIDLSNIIISGGVINNTTIGDVTPKAATFSPLKAKGPAAITTFAGTISRSGTTLTFSSAADAVLAGYSATNPILGATVIHPTGPVTMYITAWLSDTTATVATTGALAAQTPTSVQLPISTFVNSAGVWQGWMNAAGQLYFTADASTGIARFATLATGQPRIILNSGNTSYNPGFQLGFGTNDNSAIVRAEYIDVGNQDLTFWTYGSSEVTEKMRIKANGNIGIGTSTFGTSAAKVLAMGSGTAPTTSPADAAQMWVADDGAVAGKATVYMRDEAGNSAPLAFSRPPEVDGKTNATTLTIPQVSNTFITNVGQGANNVNLTLPTPAAGYSFVMQAGEPSGNYWRITAAVAGTMIVDGVPNKDYASFAAPALGNFLTAFTAKSAPGSEGILTGAALAQGSTPTAAAHGAFNYYIGGIKYAKGADAAGVAPGNDVIVQNKFGCVAFDIGADGTVDATEATNQAAAQFTDAATAIAALPAVAASHVRIGYVTATDTAGTFTFGTDNLVSDATATVTYVSTAAYTATYNWIVTTGSGSVTTN